MGDSGRDDPADVVAEYFERMRHGDATVADLFTEDAELVGLGAITRGGSKIREFYADSIRRAGPVPELCGPVLVQGERVAAEIRIRLSGGTSIHVMDLFVVEDGRITSLTYFVADEP